MASCEKCWKRAYTRSRITGKDQVTCYHEILTEVDKTGIICTPEERAGQYWDEEKQIDRRFIDGDL